MKKIIIFITFCLLFIPSIYALDLSITDGSIKYENGTIKISGTSEESDVQIALFDGNETIIYEVTPVTSGNFNYVSSKIDLVLNKEYTVKVASVDGLTVKTGTLLVQNTGDINNPKTNDNIIVQVIIVALSAFGISESIFLLKRKHLLEK